MIRNWPEMKSAKGQRVADDLAKLSNWLEVNRKAPVSVKVAQFNDVLKLALDRRFDHYCELNNAERNQEFGRLVAIVDSIFAYFYDANFHYVIYPAVFEANRKFFSYRGR